jgi:hypothetical protein
MQGTKHMNGKRLWSKVLTAIPLPFRVLLMIWLVVSFASDIGLPGSTANLPPIAKFLILLPMAILSIAIGIFTLWRGCKTIHATTMSICSPKLENSTPKSQSFFLIGGMSALQIYLIGFMLAAFWLAEQSGNYGASVALSVLLAAGIGFALFARKLHPKDVKVFLIGGLLITILFGLIMATVAVPRT